uniref:Uncharacterized protein n=1 Tax=Micrurus paraensis TaxID=1970185 RepID=A0A2D4JXH8_9SAUR
MQYISNNFTKEESWMDLGVHCPSRNPSHLYKFITISYVKSLAGFSTSKKEDEDEQIPYYRLGDDILNRNNPSGIEIQSENIFQIPTSQVWARVEIPENRREKDL